MHVHAPASYDWGGGNISPTDLVDKAVAEDIAVVAITDHHSVEWADKVILASADSPLVDLPGVELRTDMGNLGIHIIGLFPEGTTAKTIYDKILAPLNLTESDVLDKGNETISTTS